MMQSLATPSDRSPLDASAWRWIAWTGVLLIAGLLMRSWMVQNTPMTWALAIFLVAGLGTMAIARLPSLLTLLLVLVALLNGAGGAFDWFETYRGFDKLVHFYSGFAGLAAIGYLYARDKTLSRARLVGWCAAMGLALGIGWEIIEELLGELEFVDTFFDIVVDTLGAALGGLFAWHAVRALRT